MATTPGPAPATSSSITVAGSVGSSDRRPPSRTVNSSTVVGGKTGRSSSVSRKSAAWSAVRRSKARVSSTARLYSRVTESQRELHEQDDPDDHRGEERKLGQIPQQVSGLGATAAANEERALDVALNLFLDATGEVRSPILCLRSRFRLERRKARRPIVDRQLEDVLVL